jgi:hypothetical protein
VQVLVLVFGVGVLAGGVGVGVGLVGVWCLVFGVWCLVSVVLVEKKVWSGVLFWAIGEHFCLLMLGM